MKQELSESVVNVKDSDIASNITTVESLAQKAINDAMEHLEGIQHSETLDFSLLESKKETWDLEQRLAEKLNKLDKQTKKAIVELARQRILSSN